ncbi:hypothetical protein DFQ27_004414 [Actinomortierella ambigua]|uniref:PiggyBac transposable element-derived protein 4 C-terminal zinc-ribbon domain-containing protein n=1 Tax=Actinomortierella ambigua TaxID=1343610 RepID=A0A9P6Q1U5_9FUNG|nr:hypothetical protein DFQ27_004414 [Actinomortierella ambigua]
MTGDMPKQKPYTCIRKRQSANTPDPTKAKRPEKDELQAADAEVKTRSLVKRTTKKLDRPSKRAGYITPNSRKEPLPNTRLVGQHLPEKALNRQHCHWCRLQGTRARAGQTYTMCSQCKIFLCTFPCFKDYHTVETSSDDYDDDALGRMASRPGSALSIHNNIGGTGETSSTLDFSDLAPVSGSNGYPGDTNAMLATASTRLGKVTGGGIPGAGELANVEDQRRMRKRREMQPVNNIVDWLEPNNGSYLWRNNGKTTQKKTGCKSIIKVLE